MYSEFDLTTQEYIEIIHELQQQNEVARVSDIAKKRGVTRSSVSTALNSLKKKKLVIHYTYGRVELTQQGMDLAQQLDKKHQVIRRFLIKVLGIDNDTADSEACKIEHYISPETVDGLLNLIKFIDKCPYADSEWLNRIVEKNFSVKGTMQCPHFIGRD